MGVIKNLMLRVGADFSAVTKQAKKASSSMYSMVNSINRSTSRLNKVLGAAGIAVGLTGIVHAAKDAAAAFNEVQENNAALAQVMKNTMGATKGQWQSILDLCDAQQRLGVIDGEVAKAGAVELATYLGLSDSLEKLLPVMDDMLAQQYGLNATSENAVNIATMLGKVMNGQTGALSRYGYSFTKAQEEILKYGTEAQRAAVLAQVVTESVGGMNAALAQTPSGRLQQVKFALGDIQEGFGKAVMTIATAFLPLLNTVAAALQKIAAWAGRVAQAIANVFGVKTKTVAAAGGGIGAAAGGISAAADAGDSLTGAMNGAAGATEKAAKAAKKLGTMNWDELNMLNSPTEDTTAASGSGGTGSVADVGGAITGIDWSAAEEAGESCTALEKILKKVKDNLDEIATVAKIIGATFLAWKISDALIKTIRWAKGLSALQGMQIGLGISFAGFASEIMGIKDAIASGLDGINFTAIIAGGLLGTGGTALLGKSIGKFIAKAFASSAVAKAITAGGGAISTGLIGAAIGGIAAGIPMFVTGLADAFKNGMNWLNGILVPAGSTLAGAGIGAIIGSLGGPIGAGIGALAGLAVGLITDLVAIVVEKWDKIKAFFVQTWDGIVAVWDKAAEWFNTTVVQPIVQIFAPIVEWISEFFRGCWIICQGVWEVASTWFGENVIQPVVGFFQQLWMKVSGFFRQLWTDICQIWTPVAEWFNAHVVQPVVNFFSTAWEKIKSTFQTAFSAIGNFAKSVFNGVIFRVEFMVNRIIGAVNGLISGFNRVVSWAANIVGANWGGLSLISEIRLPRLAEGGILQSAGLFMANENGVPELVGRMGSHAAVANNGQIQEGIASAVVRTLLDTGLLSYVRSIADSSERTARKDFTLGKPSSTAGRWVSQSLDAYDAVRG